MAGERGIKEIKYITGAFVWATKTGGSEVEIPMGNVLLDGTDLGTPEAFATMMADDVEVQDGVRLNGVIRVDLGTTLPGATTVFWLKVTPHAGTVTYYGGTDGFRGGKIVEKAITALSTGRAYIDFMYQAVAAAASDLYTQ